MQKEKFSSELEGWLKSKEPKTIIGLSEVFREKAFAVIFLLLMFLPSLPLPTGGITHIFEIITMLLAIELILGQKTIWLPKRWRNLELGKAVQARAIPFIIRRIKWFEKVARPRLKGLVGSHLFLRLIGIITFVFALAAFVAPPFSGLDTLPSLGAVIVALAIIFDDAMILVLGILAGTVGIGTIIGLDTVIFGLIHRLLSQKL